jgi:hypothetical protein
MKGDSAFLSDKSRRRWSDLLIFAGIILLVLGARLFVGIRFVSEMPQADDLDTTRWLAAWALGQHDWSFIFHRINGHPMEFYYLANLGQFLLNGAWDARLDFIVSALIHTCYAGVALWVFCQIALPQERGWVAFLILTAFALPFGGYRISWGLLWVHTAMIMFAVLTIYAASRRPDTWGQVILIVVFATFAALNNGAGCLAALVVGMIVSARAFISQKLNAKEIALISIGLVIFLSFYLSMPKGNVEPPKLTAAVSLFLKTIGWPLIFTPVGGLLSIVAISGLAVSYALDPKMRTRPVEALVGIGAYLILVSLATGFLRGEETMPSGRYTDILLIVPVVCALSLTMLIRRSRGRVRYFWSLFASVWCLAQVFGVGLHVLYRTLPFISGGNGEWTEAAKQDRLREISRGSDIPVISLDIAHANPLVAMYLTEWSRPDVTGPRPFPAMTVPMMAGFPIANGSKGNFVSGGYPPAYAPRSTEHYVGSYDLNQITNDGKDDKEFISGTFQPTAPYLTMDLLVDKSARFSAYRLQGTQLELVDDTSGERRELLPLLRNTAPLIFRDWELIYFPVTPGHAYHLEARVTGIEADHWLAFGEPRESGRLTPFIIGFSQSGKLFCLLGLLLVTLGGIVLVFPTEEKANAVS